MRIRLHRILGYAFGLLAMCIAHAASESASQILRDKLASGGDGPELIRIPAGEFVMGGGDGDAWMNGLEVPRHSVRIGKAFAMGKFEVTRGQYRQFATATQADVVRECIDGQPGIEGLDFSWLNSSFEQTDEHPVVCVSRKEALAFLAWLSKETGARYRLPTEAEWEYAARAGTTTKYIAGDQFEEVCKHGNVHGDRETFVRGRSMSCADGYRFTAPVGKFLPNALGLFDMTGNASEMVEDCFFDNYKGAPADGSPWTKPRCTDFVERGGSWGTEGEYLRVAHRTMYSADERDARMSFRVVREID